ncbi:TUB1, partial [Symbiodinium pilosum]
MSYGVSAPFTANIGSRKSNVAPSLICLHLGGEGSDVGTACWKRLMDEHLLDASGRPTEGAFFGCSTPFFAESTTGRYVPRAVFAGYGAARMESVSKAGLFAPTSVL